MKFLSAFSALAWAEEVWSIREGGRTTYREEFSDGNVGLPKDFALLDAIEIRCAAKRACWNGLPCPITRQGCLFHWLLPDPCIVYPEMSQAQIDRIKDCVAMFEELLRKKGFME